MPEAEYKRVFYFSYYYDKAKKVNTFTESKASAVVYGSIPRKELMSPRSFIENSEESRV